MTSAILVFFVAKKCAFFKMNVPMILTALQISDVILVNVRRFSARTKVSVPMDSSVPMGSVYPAMNALVI
jgi:hypothetical protein